MPRRILLEDGPETGLGTLNLFLRLDLDGLGEAGDGSFVADQTIAFDDNLEDNGVIVAVGGGGNDAEAVAAGFAFHPELLAGAAPEGNEAGFEGFGVADGVEEAEHKDFACTRILDDAWNEAVHLFKINLWQFGRHWGSLGNSGWAAGFGLLPQKRKARWRLTPAGIYLIRFWPFSSGHSSPPTWASHDDGDDDDGDESASGIEIMKAGLVCQIVFGELCCELTGSKRRMAACFVRFG